MPILPSGNNKPFVLFDGAHRQTILPNLFRTIKGIKFERERIILPDGDFIDADWLRNNNDKLIIAIHGLEGNSQRQYIQGLLGHMRDEGWDGMGFNFRGCSGEQNLKAQSYHCAATEDLSFVVQEICDKKIYKKIVLVGFSLGGNVALLYSGQMAEKLPDEIMAVIGVSVPTDLVASVDEMDKWYNRQYLWRFLVSLKEKARNKADLLEDYNLEKVWKAKTFHDFDEEFTAPVHGFTSAMDYWTRASSLPFLGDIKVPALLINAKNDTFLSESSSPLNLADSSDTFHLLNPSWGGHVGFYDGLSWASLWSERQIAHFLTKILAL